MAQEKEERAMLLNRKFIRFQIRQMNLLTLLVFFMGIIISITSLGGPGTSLPIITPDVSAKLGALVWISGAMFFYYSRIFVNYLHTLEGMVEKLADKDTVEERILTPFAMDAHFAERVAERNISFSRRDSDKSNVIAQKKLLKLKKKHDANYQKLIGNLYQMGFRPELNWRTYLKPDPQGFETGV